MVEGGQIFGVFESTYFKDSHLGGHICIGTLFLNGFPLTNSILFISLEKCYFTIFFKDVPMISIKHIWKDIS